MSVIKHASAGPAQRVLTAPRPPNEYPPPRPSQPIGSSLPGHPGPSTIRAPNHSTLELPYEGASRYAPSTAVYLVSTETAGVSDLRLQVTENWPEGVRHGAGVTTDRKPRPLWFRERTLTAKDEIVDRLVDASTGRATWTIHRPTRGWYLHVRSPALPPGCAIPLRPARPDFVTSTTGIHDPTSTPLTLSLTTKVHLDPLRRCRDWIDETGDQKRLPQYHSASPRTDKASELRQGGDAEDFLAVNINEPSQQPRHNVAGTSSSRTEVVPSEDNRTSTQDSSVPRGHTARTSSISSTITPTDAAHQNHARRRSGGRTSFNPSDSQKSFSGRFEGVAEVQEDEEVDATRDNQRAREAAAQALPLRSVDGESLRNNPTHTCDKDQSSQLLRCCFLLLDGAARFPPSKQGPISTLAPGRIAQGSQRLGWARWVWSLVPEPIRPALTFDTTKSFSIQWIEVPQPSQSQLGGAGDGTGRQGPEARAFNHNERSAGSQLPPSDRTVEVLKYVDQGSKWSILDSKTRGRFVLQEDAIQALGVDRGFWIALGLAYLEFLEERDGYNAASGG